MSICIWKPFALWTVQVTYFLIICHESCKLVTHMFCAQPLLTKECSLHQPHHWLISLLHHFTFSPFHHFTFSPFFLFTISPFHHFTISPFNLFTISPFAFSPFHLITISHFPFSPFHHFTSSPFHFFTISPFPKTHAVLLAPLLHALMTFGVTTYRQCERSVQ